MKDQEGRSVKPSDPDYVRLNELSIDIARFTNPQVHFDIKDIGETERRAMVGDLRQKMQTEMRLQNLRDELIRLTG